MALPWRLSSTRNLSFVLYLTFTICVIAALLPTSLAQNDCDPNCNSGCLTRGAGQCDGDCKIGTGPIIVSDNRVCANCTANCASGCNKNGGNSCDNCTAGYGLTKDTPPVCKACSNDCVGGCTIAGGGGCDRCSLNFGLNSTTNPPTCSPCDPKCADGCIKQGAGKCDSRCSSAFAVNNVTHVCEACDQRCTSLCRVRGPGRCDTECQLGSALTTDFTCGDCAKNCLSGCPKNGPGSCDVCIPGYGLTDVTEPEKPTCELCGGSCKDCSLAGAGRCDVCVDGYGLVDKETDKTCAMCDPNCKEICMVQGASKCDEICNFGYALDTTTHTCVACQADVCDGGCIIAGPGNCDGDCIDGYGINNVTKKCERCDVNCKNETGCATAGAGKCEQGGCVWGFASTENLTCAACQKDVCWGGCNMSGPGNCDKNCSMGYGINPLTKKCERCDVHCKNETGDRKSVV